jgi:hypothetical protein
MAFRNVPRLESCFFQQTRRKRKKNKQKAANGFGRAINLICASAEVARWRWRFFKASDHVTWIRAVSFSKLEGRGRRTSRSQQTASVEQAT